MVSASDLLRARGPAQGLCVVAASAGSGKTHHLTHVVLDALRADVDVENLVAVTYTTRAAAELRSRIRQELVRNGQSESALRLPLARLGTVHAVCLGWVEDFAIDAGLPPAVRVLPDDGGLQFRRLLEQAIPAELQTRLSRLGRALQVKWDSARNRSDWLWHVFELIDLARANRIAPSALPGMAQRSIEWLSEILPPPSERDLEGALRDALDRAVSDLEHSDDHTKATKQALHDMKTAQRLLRQHRASWKDWATLAALESGKKSREVVESVSNIAAELDAHPPFQDDLRQMITGVFQCAELGLERYQGWKQRLRLIDYVDMLERTLELLDRPEVARELAGRLRMVVVDEFQDTSPVQLELFLRLHQLTRRSTWVGDRKQCIFEFAGADPQLMDSVTRRVAEHGGSSEQLPANWRSRPELVNLCSDLFSRALARYGYARAEVAVRPHGATPSELAPLPPIGIFSLDASNAAREATALALGIQRLLSAPAATPILDRHTGQVRSLRAGDLAVLVRTNAEAETLARELGQLRIRAALARPGLLQTPEGTLVDAALSYLVDPLDGVAAATLDALHGFSDGDPDRWLEEQIRASHARRDAAAARLAAPLVSADPGEPANDTNHDGEQAGWRATLAALATQTRQLSPRETVDAVLQALDLSRIALGWPDPEQRTGNLDALRALATQYEDTCRIKGAAATLSGLLHHFDQAREARWDGNEMRASDEQHYAQGPSAVALCTYHRAKGLEWPVVILSSLDATPRADAFGVNIEAPEGDLNPERPLEGRWIRYVPRALSGRKKNLGFVEREEQSAQGQRARQDERCERARLLYVGFTRARDHLILAVRNRKGELQTQWLDELRDNAGNALLRLPATFENEDATIGVAGTEQRVRARAWHIALEAASAQVVNDTAAVLTWQRPAPPPAARPAYWINPSNDEHAQQPPSLRIAELVRIAPALTVRRVAEVDWATFGNTVHAFLAVDRTDDERALRLERAERLLTACASGASLEPEALLAMSDALTTFVATRWPGAVWHREVPISVLVGEGPSRGRINGSIDLLLETSDSFVVIDHKTYGNPDERAMVEHAEQYLGQLGAYGAAIDGIGGKRVGEWWVHFGVGGVCVRATLAS